MKIKAICEVEYDTEDVLNDLRHDYPNESWDETDAKSMIYSWIKDDFGGTLMDYRIEENNASTKV